MYLSLSGKPNKRERREFMAKCNVMSREEFRKLAKKISVDTICEVARGEDGKPDIIEGVKLTAFGALLVNRLEKALFEKEGE